MVLQSSRRRVLRTGGVLAATALAGCTALSGGGGEDPDAGKDSYGIRLVNDTEETHSVTITAGPHGGDETTFEETVDSEPNDPQEWDEVLTEQQIYVVRATVDHDEFVEEWGNPVRTVSVGAENSVEAENLLVEVDTRDPGAVFVHVYFPQDN
jgi:hypothetical protein